MAEAETSLEITEDQRTFARVAADASKNTDFQEHLRSCDLLLLPSRQPEFDGDVFEESTRDLLRFLKRELPDRRIDVATESDAPAELQQHDDMLFLAAILVTDVFAPIAIQVLASFIYDWASSRPRGPKQADVRAKIVIAKADGSSVCLSYEGPAKTFEATVGGAATKLLGTSDENT